MFTHLSREGTDLPPAARKTGARRARLAAVLTAVTCGLLASAAIIPAGFARLVPDPGEPYGPISPAPAATVRVVTADGMAGWQIALIALGAALVAATAAALLDRALAAHRARLRNHHLTRPRRAERHRPDAWIRPPSRRA